MSLYRVFAVSAVSAVLAVQASSARAATSFEQAQDLDPYFTIGEVKIEEVPAVGSYTYPDFGGYSTNSDLDEADLILDKIINMGKKVFKIINDNRPVVNVKVDVANALPAGLKEWNQLSGWKAPQTKVYKITYKNLYGMTVVDFSYRVHYSYGGSANGKGLHLTNVTVVPAFLAVSWGYTFKAEVTVPNVNNAGTSEAPMGAMELMVHWSVDTMMRHMQHTTSYYVRGDGLFMDLSNGNSSGGAPALN